MKYIISVTTETILLVPHAIRVSILITCKTEENRVWLEYIPARLGIVLGL